MRPFFLLLAILGLHGLPSVAQYLPVVADSFPPQALHRDLTTLFTWGTNTGPESAFRRLEKADSQGLSFSAITQTDSARRYAGYQNANSLKASLAFDYRFPEIDRGADSIRIDFDVLWDQLVSGGNQGRIVVALMHDLPESIPAGALVDSFDAKAPFGRPAYSFRILNRTPQGTNNYANMMYGGGKDSLGEFERFQNGPLRWWLPGFISGPGGISPEASVQYPLGPVNRWTARTLASATTWTHYTWKIFPERLEVWYRLSSQPESAAELTLAMTIPRPGPLPEMLAKLQQGHGLAQAPDSLPTLYRWFPAVNGLRFYMAGQNPTYFANVKVGTSQSVSSAAAHRVHPRLSAWPNPVAGTFSVAPYQPGLSWFLIGADGKRQGIEPVGEGRFALPHCPPGLYQIQNSAGQSLRIAVP